MIDEDLVDFFDARADDMSPGLTLIEGRPATAPRSYVRAGSYARVAGSSSSDSLRSATATRRWTAEETRSRVALAPEFRNPRPDEEHLDELVAGYVLITRDPVRRLGKRNLIAACYRVHGDAFLALVRARFAETGTVTNLLGEIRCTAPAVDVLDVQAAGRDVEADLELLPSPLQAPLRPDLIYDADHPRPFDGTSNRRYDRRPSNPDAASFFRDDELRALIPSSTSRALSR